MVCTLKRSCAFEYKLKSLHLKKVNCDFDTEGTCVIKYKVTRIKIFTKICGRLGDTFF